MTPAATQNQLTWRRCARQHRHVRWQADPERRAARGPGTRSGAPAETVRRPARWVGTGSANRDQRQETSSCRQRRWWCGRPGI